MALVEHDPGWAHAFAEEKRRVGQALGGLALDIQHAGSTAVPGIRAKPILDIVVGVALLAAAAECVEPLNAIGYDCLGGEVVPDGLFFAKGHPRTHHLHVVAWQQRRWFNDMLFRDRLLADPATARRYEVRKMVLARRFPADRAAYTRSKAAFIERVLAETPRPGGP